MKSLKQIAFLLLLGSMPFQQANAQEKKKDEPKLRLGIKGGFSLSTLNQAKDANRDNARIGFNVGLFAKMPLLKMVSIQPELYIATKGATMSYNNTLFFGTAQFNLNYIELPVFVVVNVTKNLNIHAGPYGGVLLSGNVINQSNIIAFDFENEINKNNYNTIDAGFAIGGGMDVGAMSFGLRYYQGFTKVGRNRPYKGFNYTFPDAYNSLFNAYINFTLN